MKKRTKRSGRTRKMLNRIVGKNTDAWVWKTALADHEREIRAEALPVRAPRWLLSAVLNDKQVHRTVFLGSSAPKIAGVFINAALRALTAASGAE